MATPKKLYFLHKLLTLTMLTSAVHLTAALNCAANCKCSWVLDSLEVNCANSGLIEYPKFELMPIERVDLSSNYFTEFPSQLSVHDSLIYLDLANNQIEYLDANALQGFNALRTLILANNTINRWLNLNPTVAFLSAGSLQRLVLNGNALQTFTVNEPQQVIVSESLTHLELENCAISQAGGDLLIQNMPNLERLNLNRNPLGTLAKLPSKSLRVLELSSCNLQKISASLTDGLPALEYLNLSWNTALRVGAADRLESMTINELDLSYCSLDEIDVTALPSLQQLRLRGNMLRSLAAQTFANNTLLETIDLSRNSLRSLEAEVFYKLKKLSTLDLAYNEIAHLDRNVFRSNDNLASLNLSHNVLDKFTKIISNSLRDINLSWCEIILIEGTALSSLSSLQKLDLSHNLIRDLPSGMRSATLQKLDLSYCRLSALSNSTFQHFPELAQLKLNGNRFTNPFPREYFRSNKYLDAIWVGDNTWICDCQDVIFMDFYDYLTANPARIKDRNSLRCASPTYNYGKTWQTACEKDWIQNDRSSNAQKIWSTLFLTIVVIGSLIFLLTCFQKFMAWRRKRSDAAEYRRNHDEMRQIRRLNQRILDEEARPNAPSSFGNTLPSYEDALRMPKPVRPVKSMLDLSEETSRRRRRLRKMRTNPEHDITEEDENDIQYDYRNRFRSEEMLTNRNLERVQHMDPARRTGRIMHNNSGSRRFSIEDSRFPAAHLKSQNLRSAEQIGNFQSYENSPYTKRKPKIAEIPPFKRANLRADSVEFLTDPEYEVASKPSSPFAIRKPKSPSPTATPLAPAVEDYFSANLKTSDSPDDSDFHIVIEPDVRSLRDIKYDTSSTGSDGDQDDDDELIRGKCKKLRNSSSRRASGSFIAAAATAAGETSEEDPIIVVHRPMRETLF